jgi:Mg2+-importing ATPase
VIDSVCYFLAMTTDSSPLLQALPDALAALQSNDKGLTSAQAQDRLAQNGPNALVLRRERPVLLQFLARFKNPLVLLLLVASALSASTGDVASSVITMLVILLSITLDFVQERRAGKAAEKLKAAVAHRVQVWRDGQMGEKPAESLVLGDVVELLAGTLVPADLRVIAARDCFVNQTLLTGESYPVEKQPNDAATSIEPADATHLLFMGTTVVSGTATALVVRTGSQSALGAIGKTLEREAPPTAFETGTRRFGLMILRLAAVMVVFVLTVCLARHRPLLEALLFSAALAVGLTPELLPMVVSVTLARGALRMAKKQVIVKRLGAIHDLGSMDVLCTDKTGTLTEAKIRLERHVDAQGRDSARVLWLALLNSTFESGLKSPMDEAILKHGEVDIAGWQKVDEVPFDFERRRVSVLVENGQGEKLLVVKGALEDVVRLSTRWEGDGPADLRPLDDAAREQITARFDGLGQEGFRVLGVAWKVAPADLDHARIDDECTLNFCGFAAFEDPPKESAKAALAQLAARGVTVKVISGDNEQVTAHVCQQVGLTVAGHMTGADLEQLDDAALAERVENTTLFCRMNPTQKARVVQALRQKGHVVGYLGDGINDAPPLHAADVGISVDSGADVAKEAADMILLQQDLAVLNDGIAEGRRTFANILKYVMMSTSSNFGNMFSMAASALILPFLPMLPVQVLLNNFMYDLSEMPIPLDRVDNDWLKRPHRWDMRFIRNFMLALGPVSSLFDIGTFGLLWWWFGNDEKAFHTGWFIESLATQVLVIFVIRTRRLPWKSLPSRALILTSLSVVVAAFGLPFLPLAAWVGLVPLPLPFLLALLGVVAAYLVVAQVIKMVFYRLVR